MADESIFMNQGVLVVLPTAYCMGIIKCYKGM